MRTAFAILVLLGLASAHVSLFYRATGGPVRNAPAPNPAAPSLQDGAFSVAGPCGGVADFGVNGVMTVTAGKTMSFQINYNGGHAATTNIFKTAWACNAAGPSEADMLAAPRTGNVPAPDGQITGGYTVPFQVPANALGKCTVSVIETNNWGGCVDMQVNAAPPPPAPPPAVPPPSPPPAIPPPPAAPATSAPATTGTPATTKTGTTSTGTPATTKTGGTTSTGAPATSAPATSATTGNPAGTTDAAATDPQAIGSGNGADADGGKSGFSGFVAKPAGLGLIIGIVAIALLLVIAIIIVRRNRALVARAHAPTAGATAYSINDDSAPTMGPSAVPGKPRNQRPAPAPAAAVHSRY